MLYRFKAAKLSFIFCTKFQPLPICEQRLPVKEVFPAIKVGCGEDARLWFFIYHQFKQLIIVAA